MVLRSESPVTIVGESLVDLVRKADGTVTTHPGGSPANVAVGLARLGTPVALMTRYGRDPYGAMLAEHLTGNGVSLLGDVDGAAATSVAAAVLDASGAASYDFRITWDLAAGQALAQGSVGLHVGSIAATLAPGADAVREMVARARGLATVSYDPNCRPSLMGDVAAARTWIEGLVALADVVKASDEDLAWLHPGRAVEDVAAEWQTLGPALVAVTRGGDGVHGRCAAGAVDLPRVVVEVVDTVGAGDAFMAGLLDGLHRRGLLGAPAAQALAEVDLGSLDSLLGEASLVAALTCARPGADPPTAAEVDAATP